MLAEKLVLLLLVYACHENAPHNCQEVANVDDGIFMLSEKSLLLLMMYASAVLLLLMMYGC